MFTTGLNKIIITTNKMQQCVTFYRDVLQLQITYPFGVEDYSAEAWVSFDGGNCVLMLQATSGEPSIASSPLIVFEVPDIQAARNHLIENKVAVSEIRAVAPGLWMVDAVDAVGNPFAIEMND